MDQLQSRLREQLKGKRFLLVLDDVWNDNGNCEKVWGVPLAAKALGSLMRFKTEEHEWMSIKDSDLWRLPLEEVGILPALRISYNHLPFHLRQCFSYCAIFPKGTEYFIMGKETKGDIPNGVRHLRCVGEDFPKPGSSKFHCARDCVEANLKGKPNLARLHLVWNDEGVNRVKIDFDVLGNLEPHRNLKALGIKGYRDNRFPRWMTDPLLLDLVLISLKQCRNCQNLPALGQLPSLKDVQLEELDALQFIEGGSVVRRQREWFPSLKIIFLFANPNLESWVKEEEEEVSLHSVVVLSVLQLPQIKYNANASIT
ncbi:hypothetical protein IFM89_022498 [Coptis chinensis]|uniref:NB-ARC domain-containing protein n=1 Tax=Coptis chinensis TaxID=261450 RepID=A0A835M947_9MAGN|nr:hypothetical protein IFM89_022498 [Coptis chinensis]